MGRYFKLFGQFFSFSLKREMEYKSNLLINLCVDLIYYGAHLVLFEIIYAHIDSIGSFSKGDMVIFILTFYMMENAWDFFFGNNLNKLNNYIVYGELDFLITKPIPSQFYASFRYVRPPCLMNFMIIVAALIYALNHFGYEVTPLRVLVYAVLGINSVMIIYIIDFFASVLVFWARRFTHARWLWYEIVKLSHRPDIIYPRFAQRIMWVFPPLIVINSIPTRVLIKDFPLIDLWPIPIVTGILLYLTHVTWQRGLRRYESASS